MKLVNLFEKLRKKNKGDYRQFQFCIFFAVMLIASYVFLLYSPLVQGSMPEGGDTRKQVYLSFGICLAGCTVFAAYAVKLFLRYKSREIGIFLALGTEKGKLKKALYKELGKMMVIYCLEGILGGAVLSMITGQIAYALTKQVETQPFAYRMQGLLAAFAYSLILSLLVMWMAQSSMKRTNIMDVINEQRKQEPMRQAVSSRYLTMGILLVIVGILGALVLPQLTAKVFYIFLGGWTNLFYLLAAVGVYQIMVYSISCHKKGKNPQKYYKNLLNYGMVKFQGASMVKNMLVITFLIMGGLYALFYLPQANFEVKNGISIQEDEYSYRYTNDADEITEQEIKKLAKTYQVEIKNYREAEMIKVIGDGVERDVDDNKNAIQDYYDSYAEYECISASEYERLTGKKVEVKKGTYFRLIQVNGKEGVWYHFDDVSKFYSEAEQSYLPLSYVGNEVYSALIINDGMGDFSRFIVNDEDYQKLRKGLPKEKIVTQVLFDTTDGDGEIPFASALWKEYGERISETMNVMEYYDPCTEKRSKGGYDFRGAIFDPNEPLKETDWKYAPSMVPLKSQQSIMLFAVRFIMFFYVFVICMAAVGIISYTRSQSVGMSNALVFSDLEKLGADKNYVRTLLKQQIQKVFILPTSLGICLITGFQILIMYINDGVLQSYERKVAMVAVILGICVALYQYGIYRFSLKKVRKMLGL